MWREIGSECHSDVALRLGAIQHRPGPPAHWVALRRVDGEIVELDSLQKAPSALSTEAARRLLADFPDTYAILAV